MTVPRAIRLEKSWRIQRHIVKNDSSMAQRTVLAA
jgi:hypothetical protein